MRSSRLTNLVFAILCFVLVFVMFVLKASYIVGPTSTPIFPSTGTPAFVQAVEAHTAGTPTSLAVSFSALPTVGNIVLLLAVNGNDGDPTNGLTIGVTDNQHGNVYARLQINPNTPASAPRVSVWCAPVTQSGGTFTITESAASNLAPGVMAAEYSGTSCNLDAWANGNGATSPYSCGSVTTANAHDLVLAAIEAGSSTSTVTFTASTGFTIRKSQTVAASGQVVSYADDIVSATATFTPTYGTGQNHASTPCSTIALLSR
jgi:hypothetical protein